LDTVEESEDYQLTENDEGSGGRIDGRNIIE
jgi:hypothetical protein